MAKAKAIRDLIPEIAAANGDLIMVTTVEPEPWRHLLVEKLTEELQEFLDSDARDLTELADLVEVAYAIAPDLDEYRTAKRAEAGGFNDRWVMVG